MSHSKVKSFPLVLFLSLNLCSASLNIGYVLTYLTLSIDTLFKTLNITEASEKTRVLSIVNGVMPLGNFTGVFIGFLIGKKFTNKICLHIADFIGMLSILTLIQELETIIAFRFVLGMSNGIISYIVPIYLKSICPEQYYVQFSMIFGYFLNLGVLIGQLMGIGYINWNGKGTYWWRVVFAVPPLLCLIRTINIFAFLNYDSPHQLFQRGREEEGLDVLKALYVEEEVQNVATKMRTVQTKKQNFTDIFNPHNIVPLKIGVISMLVQIWCGSFAVFYYSAQIFKTIAKGDLVKITIYTICIGAFSVPAQFFTIAFIKYLGSKYTLVFGCFLLGIINFIVGSISTSTEEDQLFVIFILLVFIVVVYGMTIGPVAWGLVPQINESDGTYLVMEFRWAFQTILIFSFPYIVESINIMGAFYIFGSINLIYSIYSLLNIKDTRGMTPKQIFDEYRRSYQVMQTSEN
ncbi:hypothetical protein pb186bvf_002192 [Paramecium bursaria]